MTEEVARPGPAASGFSVKCAIAALQKRDIATGPLLQRAGLSEHALDNPRHRISAIAQMKFLEYAAEAMDDTAFGLHLAEQSDPREAGLLFYVVSAARNLGEAMALFARYNRIVNESARAKIVRQTASVILQVSFVGVPRHRARHISEFEAALIVKVIREITRDHRPPHPTDPNSFCPRTHCRLAGVRTLLRPPGRVRRAVRSTGVLQRHGRTSAYHRRPDFAGDAAAVLR